MPLGNNRYRIAIHLPQDCYHLLVRVDELYNWNDVELFDLTNDPGEVKNLAANRAANSETIMAMSEKLEAVIKTEIGVDDGHEMPDIPNVDWKIERVDL